MVRFVLVAAALAALAGFARPAGAEAVFETPKPFERFVADLQAAIAGHRMGLVAEACASCGARAIGETIPGNRVLMIFRPDFAVRMLRASEAAGIEAPLRLYVTERPDGSARLVYREPSAVFAPYGPALAPLARELDAIVAAIAADALR